MKVKQFLTGFLRAVGSRRAAVLIVSSALLTGPLVGLVTAQTAGVDSSIQSFAGTWTSLCQDGKPFVILSLQVISGKIEGTVSVANANFGGASSNGTGICTVKDPASPSHTLQILRATVDGKKLTIDSRGPLVQIDVTGKDAAKLTFPGESNAYAFFEAHKTAGP